jgi:hypothetical protein
MLWAVIIAYLISVLAAWIAFAAFYRTYLLEGRLSHHEDVLRVLAKRTEPARRAPTKEPF